MLIESENWGAHTPHLSTHVLEMHVPNAGLNT